MSKIIAEYPFFKAVQSFRQAKSIDSKKNKFKSILEAYVKFTLAVHTSWLLDKKKANVPVNMRVQLVQMFQKPPSLGSINSLSFQINKIILREENENSILYDFATFFDQVQELLVSFIQIRNKDAHASIVIDNSLLKQIKEGLNLLLMNPIFKESSLIIADVSELKSAGIKLSKGFDNLNLNFLLLKEELVYKSEQWELSGKELCLMPFVICNLESFDNEDDYEILFWNQRNGKKGLYQSYLNMEAPIFEIESITEFSGFPYEDWKKASNPIYLNYLKSRSLALEEYLEDDSIGIQMWYEEMLMARKLELDVQINDEERISDIDFILGLNKKMELLKENEIKKFFHLKIIEFRNSNYFTNQRVTKNTLFSAEVIFNSFVYLYKSAVDLNDKVGYNEYYIGALNWVTKLYYLYDGSFLIYEYLFKLNLNKLSNIWRLVVLLRSLIILILSFIFWFVIESALVNTLISLVGIVCYIKFNWFDPYKIFNQNKYYINAFNFHMCSVLSRNKSFALSTLNKSITLESPFFEFNQVAVTQFDYKDAGVLKDFVNTNDLTDLQLIVIQSRIIKLESNTNFDEEYFNYYDKSNPNINPYSLHYLENKERFIQKQFDSISEIQKVFLIKKLANLLFKENVYLINIWYQKINSNIFDSIPKISDLDKYYLEIIDNNFNDDYLLFSQGLIVLLSGDFSKAAFYWKKIESELPLKIISNYNLAVVDGYHGNVNLYFSKLYDLQLQLIESCPEDLKWLENHIEQSLSYKSAPITEYQSNKIKYQWTKDTRFSLLFPYTYYPFENNTLFLEYKFVNN
jgi:hypothetical protein